MTLQQVIHKHSWTLETIRCDKRLISGADNGNGKFSHRQLTSFLFFFFWLQITNFISRRPTIKLIKPFFDLCN